MSDSVVELQLADFVTQLETMSVANGYRNNYASVGTTYKGIEQVTSFPEVVILFNDGTLTAEDSAKTVFSEYTNVSVIAYIRSTSLQTKNADNDLADVAESVIHDLKKCLTAFVKTNINEATKRYLIIGKDNIFRIARLFPLVENKGIVEVNFTIKTRYNTSSTF